MPEAVKALDPGLDDATISAWMATNGFEQVQHTHPCFDCELLFLGHHLYCHIYFYIILLCTCVFSKDRYRQRLWVDRSIADMGVAVCWQTPKREAKPKAARLPDC